MNFNRPSHKLMLQKSQSFFLPLQAPKKKTKQSKAVGGNPTLNSQPQRNSSNPSEISEGRGQIPKGNSFSTVTLKQRSPGAAGLHWPGRRPGMQPGQPHTPLPRPAAGQPTSRSEDREGAGAKEVGTWAGRGATADAEPTPPPPSETSGPAACAWR